jgi:hypothetical protein
VKKRRSQTPLLKCFQRCSEEPRRRAFSSVRIKRRKSLNVMDNDRVLKLSCVISLVLFYVFTRAHHDTKRSGSTNANHRLSRGRLFDASYDPTYQAQPTVEEGRQYAFTDLRVFESLCLPNRVTIQTLQLPLLLDTRNEPRSKNICF